MQKFKWLLTQPHPLPAVLMFLVYTANQFLRVQWVTGCYRDTAPPVVTIAMNYTWPEAVLVSGATLTSRMPGGIAAIYQQHTIQVQ